MTTPDDKTLDVWSALPKAIPDTCDTLERARELAARTGQPGFYRGVVNGRTVYIMNHAATVALGAVGVTRLTA